jgi:hypothetical protein
MKQGGDGGSRASGGALIAWIREVNLELELELELALAVDTDIVVRVVRDPDKL